MGKEYLKQLRDPRWQKKRLEILNRDNFTCQHCLCKDKELQVHHRYYEKDKLAWEYDDNCFITLCKDCHKSETKENYECYQNLSELKKSFLDKGFSMAMLNMLTAYLCSYVDSTEDYKDDDEMRKCMEHLFTQSFYGALNYNDALILSEMGINTEGAIEELHQRCFILNNNTDKYEK